MKKIENNIRKSLLKRQEVLNCFKAKKASFQDLKKQITKDIEEARSIWKHTLEQLPGQEFN